jgi:ferritin-like protein
MTGVARINSNDNVFVQENVLAELETDYLRSKKEFDALLDKMQQIVQEITKLVQELMAWVGSKTPPTPDQLAQIMGQMDVALGESKSCLDDCNALFAKTEFAALGAATPKAKKSQIQEILNEETKLKKKELQLSQLFQKADEIEQSQKKLMEAIAKMLAKHGPPKMSELQQLIQEIDQLEKKLALVDQKSR